MKSAIAQSLDQMIRPYLNTTHITKSSDELLIKLKDLKCSNIKDFTSLDVESLFTNVPVVETIDIIINEINNHPSLPPPPINAELIKELLLICTTETPFNFNNQTYIQVDGVSMGSFLGPLFSDFYMSSLENKVLT